MSGYEKSAFQYLETHDHSRLICCYGVDDLEGGLYAGHRGNWYRLQPHMIGLLLGKGVPLLWQGQELVENYVIPDKGMGRIGLLRPVRWEYFYDTAGKGMIRLVRALLALRREQAVFRRGDYYFCNNWDRYQSKGLLPFHRTLGETCALVALNFSDVDITERFTTPLNGIYTECLHGTSMQVTAGHEFQLTIPSNYGQVWVRKH